MPKLPNPKSIKKELRQVNINSLQPYWRNPRDNTRAVEIVKQSITTYGYANPIMVDSRMIIIAGHTRYKALTELGWKGDVDVLVMLDISEQDAKQLRLVDNKTAEAAEWTDDLLQELKGFDDLKRVQMFFPDTQITDSGDIEFAGTDDYSDEQIQKEGEHLEGRFRKENEAEMNQMLKLMCPDCGHDFFMKRREILNNPGLEVRDGE